MVCIKISVFGWHLCPLKVSQFLFSKIVLRWPWNLHKDWETICSEHTKIWTKSSSTNARRHKNIKNCSLVSVFSTLLFKIDVNLGLLDGILLISLQMRILLSVKNNWKCYLINMRSFPLKLSISLVHKLIMEEELQMIKTFDWSRLFSKIILIVMSWEMGINFLRVDFIALLNPEILNSILTTFKAFL